MLPLREFDFSGKRVLLRADLDIPSADDLFRVKRCLPTVDLLRARGAIKVTVIGHRGRPGGKVVPALSLDPIRDFLVSRYGDWAVVLPNLRFDHREREDSVQFARELLQDQDVFVQECFAGLHRRHTSIVTLPRLAPVSLLGLNVCQEVKMLGKLRAKRAGRFLVAIVGGAKVATKKPLIDALAKVSDRVLLGSKYLGDLPDLSAKQLARYQEVIARATEIVWNGPVGRYEQEEFSVGTRGIAQAIAGNSRAFKVVGGGDTVHALRKFDLLERMSFVSTGGGAMLAFIAHGDLPGLF